jgi:indolepyruvate ferredoxin oxidoreductase beta subunit
MNEAEKPITILVAALGGEGGGVLCEWLVDAATRAGYPVQGTSIPGVAQRTGATTYYVEISALAESALAGRRPVFSLTPVPGTVDLVIASELLEAARVLSAGFVDRDHTTLVTSASRTLTTVEKMAMADGRLDADKLLTAASQFSAELVSFDMQAVARHARTVVSAVMFGAVAASGKLPFARSFCEAAIRGSGKGVAASVAGFEAGFSEVSRQRVARSAASALSAADPAAPLPPRLKLAMERFPKEASDILEPALARLLDYQDLAYTDLFLNRIDAIQTLAERLSSSSSQRLALLRETARFLALWMMFDDVVRVADLKTRASRFARVRREVAARPGDVVQMADYFKPRPEEMLGVLPPRIAAFIRRRFRTAGPTSGFALALRTDSVSGFLALRGIAALRRLRPRGERYDLEQRRIEAWLAAIERVAAKGFEPAYELALCGRLVKGYGDTNARAHENLERILATLASPAALLSWGDPVALAGAIRSAREAALADPDGKALDRDIARHGAAPRPLIAKPIRLIRPARA